jgi:hypothetical protein
MIAIRIENERKTRGAKKKESNANRSTVRRLDDDFAAVWASR